MAGRENSLLDNDFEDFDEDKELVFGDDDKVDGSPKDTDKPAEIVVDVVDDTPDEDRGKWSADKLPTDDDADDEREKYSRRVKERIAKETAKVHAERRAKEDRERQLNEAIEFSKRILAENNQLKGLIENGEKVLVSESSGRLEGQIAAAKAAYREAVEAGDVNGQLAAQENLAKAIAERDRLSTHRPQSLPRMDEKELSRFTVQPQQQQQVVPDQTALSWQEKNKWFGRDEAMTAFAMGLHSQLVNREGILPSDGDQYWGRLDREMRKRFPERFQSGTARRSDIVVAPAARSNGGGATRKVTLTESQARLARRLGLTLEQYASQVAAESGQQKEWTHGNS
jgi:hypothetical protein